MNDPMVNLVRQSDRRKFGKYRATVVENNDPRMRGRLRLRIPSVLGDQPSDWALPCMPFGGAEGFGFFMVPPADAHVWVEFEEGDINLPIWSGTFWPRDIDVPEEARKDDPTTRAIKTPGGHLLQFDDEEGGKQVRLFHAADAQLCIDNNGTVSITDAGGAAVTLDAENGRITVEDSNGNTINLTSSGTTLEDGNGNKIKLGASGITIQAQQIVLDGTVVALGGSGGEPVVKGLSFLTLFATHTHPTAMGPSGPPIPQGEMSTLSMKVTAA